MKQLLPIGHESVARALEKAERYRLLNDPFCAESICLDVLKLEPENQSALVTLVLALSDQFREGDGNFERARGVVRRLSGDYERSYYAGIVCERRGHAEALHGGLASRERAWSYITEALGHYEQAMQRRTGSEGADAVLRWNTCVRLIEAHGLVAPEPERGEYPLE